MRRRRRKAVGASQKLVVTYTLSNNLEFDEWEPLQFLTPGTTVRVPVRVRAYAGRSGVGYRLVKVADPMEGEF